MGDWGGPGFAIQDFEPGVSWLCERAGGRLGPRRSSLAWSGVTACLRPSSEQARPYGQMFGMFVKHLSVLAMFAVTLFVVSVSTMFVYETYPRIRVWPLGHVN